MTRISTRSSVHEIQRNLGYLQLIDQDGNRIELIALVLAIHLESLDLTRPAFPARPSRLFGGGLIPFGYTGTVWWSA